MARFRTTQAMYVDAQNIGRVSAGKVVVDSQAAALAGDVIWTGLNSVSLPAGFTPLDSAADTMRAASRWAGQPVGIACLGVDSVDG